MTTIKKLELRLEKCRQEIVEAATGQWYDWAEIVMKKAEECKALENLIDELSCLEFRKTGLGKEINNTQSEIQLQNQELNNLVHKMDFTSAKSKALAANIAMMFEELGTKNDEYSNVLSKLAEITSRADEMYQCPIPMAS